ncbi:MAG: hypothetical protein IT457_11305 [Planctomycetes bacterium]|nr:hypothetical protein [Planctomycetota bacterium]
MSEGYQRRDAEIVDYELWRASPDGDALRGPAPKELEPGSYFVCLGAAQTFGCFVAMPWPALLAKRLGMPALNLGVAGAGPRLFLAPQWRALIDGAAFAIVQVMSGRSADCSLFASGGRERLTRRDDGRWLGADAAWSELLSADLAGIRSPLLRGFVNRGRAWFGRRALRRLVAETQASWTADCVGLLDAIAAPKLLFWFSRRRPRHRPRFHSLRALFGEYPQLVDERMLAAVARHADGLVECVGARGSPQPLRSRFTGEPAVVRPADAGTGEDPSQVWTHNAYYPSPEMHEDAAAVLFEPCLAIRSRAAARDRSRSRTSG